MNSEFAHRKRLAIQLVQYAGDLMLEAYHTPLVFHAKSPHDFVSELDLTIEEHMRHEIQSSFPADALLGEELPNQEKNAQYEWVIDPIDGTNNYVRNIPLAGSQVALLKEGVPVFGVIFQPFLQELYTAEKGEGALLYNRLTGKRVSLKVGNRPLSESLAIFDAGVARGAEPTTAILRHMQGRIEAVRVFGVAVHDFPLIAKGGADVLITSIAEPYDISVGSLLVEEAGGVVTDLEGKPWTPFSKNLLVSTPVNHNLIIKELKGII